MKEMVQNRKEELLSLIRPMKKSDLQLELISYVVFIVMSLYGIGLLLWNCIWTELMLRRNVDWINSIISLLSVILLHGFQRNLNHPFLFKYRHVCYALFFRLFVKSWGKYKNDQE